MKFKTNKQANIKQDMVWDHQSLGRKSAEGKVTMEFPE